VQLPLSRQLATEGLSGSYGHIQTVRGAIFIKVKSRHEGGAKSKLSSSAIDIPAWSYCYPYGIRILKHSIVHSNNSPYLTRQQDQRIAPAASPRLALRANRHFCWVGHLRHRVGADQSIDCQCGALVLVVKALGTNTGCGEWEHPCQRMAT